MRKQYMLAFFVILLVSMVSSKAEIVCKSEVVIENGILVDYPDTKTDVSYWIPEGVTKTMATIFYNEYVVELYFPSSCTTIVTASCFESALQRVNVDENNESYASIDGILYSKDLATIEYCPPAYPKELFLIPSTTTRIQAECFANNHTIRYLIIPEQVFEIDGFAFEASSVQQIVICGMDTTFTMDAFNFCPNLTAIWIHPGSNADIILNTNTDYIDLREYICYW